MRQNKCSLLPRSVPRTWDWDLECSSWSGAGGGGGGYPGDNVERDGAGRGGHGGGTVTVISVILPVTQCWAGRSPHTVRHVADWPAGPAPSCTSQGRFMTAAFSNKQGLCSYLSDTGNWYELTEGSCHLHLQDRVAWLKQMLDKGLKADEGLILDATRCPQESHCSHTCVPEH